MQPGAWDYATLVQYTFQKTGIHAHLYPFTWQVNVTYPSEWYVFISAYMCIGNKKYMCGQFEVPILMWQKLLQMCIANSYTTNCKFLHLTFQLYESILYEYLNKHVTYQNPNHTEPF
jgi:hypothetical protein